MQTTIKLNGTTVGAVANRSTLYDEEGKWFMEDEVVIEVDT